MELWLDTIDFDLITRATKQLHITGVTTNPSILAKSSLSAKSTIDKLLDIQPGRVAVQVTENHHVDMIKQATHIAAINQRIIIKVPVNNEGLCAIKELGNLGIQTMATAIYETTQVMLSAMAGASYAAPYLGRIKGDNVSVLQEMINIIDIYNYPLKIITAAVRNKAQIVDAAKHGSHAITLPSATFLEFISDSPETDESLQKFNQDWLACSKSLEV